MLNHGMVYKPIYFWNIEKGEESPYEIDLIIKKNDVLKTVEIKSGDKLSSHWFHGGARLGKLTKVQKYVIYNGPTLETQDGTALNFQDLDKLFEETRPSSTEIESK